MDSRQDLVVTAIVRIVGNAIVARLVKAVKKQLVKNVRDQDVNHVRALIRKEVYMAVNGTIQKTTFTDTITTGSTIIKAAHLNELSAAITILQNLKTNVNNCDCDVCTSNCCQTCQTSKCQSCQSCETTTCQENCVSCSCH